MGRVTVEKCLENVDSHFDLVLLAAEQAKQISKGNIIAGGKKAFKTHVAALRMIEENQDSSKELKEQLIHRLNIANNDELTEDNLEASNGLLEEVVNSEFIIGESASVHEIEGDLADSGITTTDDNKN
ncbi:DNA-directed RNA polymerase subunit omega [Candidatus Hepatincola sp. Av]